MKTLKRWWRWVAANLHSELFSDGWTLDDEFEYREACARHRGVL